MPDDSITPEVSVETPAVARRVRLALAGLALAGLLGVVSTLDAAGDYPGLGQGPVVAPGREEGRAGGSAKFSLP